MNQDYTARLKKIEDVLNRFLPANPDMPWLKTAFGNIPDCVNSQHVRPLVDPCCRLLKLGGKRWRPLLLVLCAEYAAAAQGESGVQSDVPYLLTPLVEFAHTASLIHDDIEDGADTSRGAPAAHITWGTDTAINAASWLYFQATQCIDNCGLPEQRTGELYRLYAQELRRLHLGQAMDIAWHREDGALPNSAEYLAMVRFKTGTLASLAARAGFIAGGGTPAETDAMGTAAADIGVGFQILDDVINLRTGNPGKKRGDDIVEGKKSLPVLLHITQHPEDADHIAALFCQARAEGIDSPAVEECIRVLLSGDAIPTAEQQANQLILNACDAAARIYDTVPVASERIRNLFVAMLAQK